MSDEKNKTSYLLLFLVMALAVIVVAVVLGYYNYKFNDGITTNHETWAQFGDFIGGVLNPVFGFLALLALLYTISLQASELRMTRKELENSATALKSQNDTMVTQSFENSFFQMLRLHNEILNSIDITLNSSYGTRGGTSTVLTGSDCFSSFRNELSRSYARAMGQALNLNEYEVALTIYQELYVERQRDLAHYFRYLYNIIKFIHNSSVDDKRFYSNLVRAQVSNNELVILFYNCMSAHGRAKFLPLAKEYELFKNMPEELLLADNHIAWLNDKI